MFCGRDAKNRNRKSQKQIAVASHTYESISIKIVRKQKIANHKPQSQIAYMRVQAKAISYSPRSPKRETIVPFDWGEKK